MRARVGLVGLLAAGGLLMTPGAAPAAPVTLTCGQVVTQNVVLAANVVDCPQGTPGLVVGANGITIDLNGHLVSATVGVDKTGAPGIVNEGHAGITIRNGTVFGASSITLQGAAFNRVVDVDASGYLSGIDISGGGGNTVDGGRVGGLFGGIGVDRSPGARITNVDASAIFIGAGSESSVVRSNLVITRNINGRGGTIAVGTSSSRVVGNAARGISIGSGAGNVVASNWVFGAVDPLFPRSGIVVAAGATNTLVRRNIAAGNSGDGIEVRSPTTALLRNTAINNGDYGIEAVPGVFGFGNVARGNGNPAQCLNVVCTSG
jgi:hypothetical protein